MVHGLSCSVACGVFPDQGLNLCPLHWLADSYSLRHQGSPDLFFIFKNLIHLEHILEHTERYEYINIVPIATWASLVAQTVRNVRDISSILGWENPLEKEMATHSNILAWWATVHGVAKSQTRLSDFHSHIAT